MPILHKFMSMDIFESFCYDPCFRVTPNWDQNDPNEFHIDETPAIKEAEERFGKKAKEDLREYMNLHGIVSLCNNLSIPYMWREYADKNRGVAVSVEINEESPFSLFSKAVSPGLSLKFERGFLYSPVNYTDMPSKHLMEFEVESFLKCHLAMKQQKWGIENESRFILPFDFISKILANQEGLKKINNILSKYMLV